MMFCIGPIKKINFQIYLYLYSRNISIITRTILEGKKVNKLSSSSDHFSSVEELEGRKDGKIIDNLKNRLNETINEKSDNSIISKFMNLENTIFPDETLESRPTQNYFIEYEEGDYLYTRKDIRKTSTIDLSKLDASNFQKANFLEVSDRKVELSNFTSFKDSSLLKFTNISNGIEIKNENCFPVKEIDQFDLVADNQDKQTSAKDNIELLSPPVVNPSNALKYSGQPLKDFVSSSFSEDVSENWIQLKKPTSLAEWNGHFEWLSSTLADCPSDSEVVRAVIIGSPNAGKSSLFNSLLGVKSSTVTPRVDTTLFNITAAYWTSHLQVVLTDTPPLSRKVENSASSIASSLQNADICLLVISVEEYKKTSFRDLTLRDKSLLKKIPSGLPVLLILNKCDDEYSLKRSESTNHLYNLLSEKVNVVNKICISCGTKFGIDGLKDLIKIYKKVSPWIFSKGESPLRLSPHEIFLMVVREKLLLNYDEEIPYLITHDKTIFNYHPAEKCIFVKHTLIFNKRSRLIIFLGSGGRGISMLSQEVSSSLSEIWGCPVYITFLGILNKKSA